MFKKNKRLIIAFLLALSILAAGCTSSGEHTRDLSTPSSRLVGHWGIYGDGDNVPKDEFFSEKWFGELNENGIGSFIMFTDGSAIGMKDINSALSYVILSESGDTVTIGSFLGDVPPDPFPQELMVSFEVTKDGQILRMVGSQTGFQYIDSKTEP